MNNLSSIACGCSAEVPRPGKIECDDVNHRHITKVLVVSHWRVGDRLFAMARDAAAPGDSPLFQIEIIDDLSKREIMGLPTLETGTAPMSHVAFNETAAKSIEHQTPFESLQQRHKRYKKPK